MSRSGVKSAETYDRQAQDWYVEPVWCTELLLNAVEFNEYVFDPAVGRGNILKACHAKNLQTFGSDIVDRLRRIDHSVAFDFLNDTPPTRIVDVPWDNPRNIITNPPYKLAQKFIERGLRIVEEKLAVLVRLEFLASQKRNALFTQHPPTKILVLSRRPSMPPGELYDPNKEARGDTLDYCWIVWDKQSDEPTTVQWLL